MTTYTDLSFKGMLLLEITSQFGVGASDFKLSVLHIIHYKTRRAYYLPNMDFMVPETWARSLPFQTSVQYT